MERERDKGRDRDRDRDRRRTRDFISGNIGEVLKNHKKTQKHANH